MRNILLAIFTALVWSTILQGCNPGVFVDDESITSGSYDVPAGDSVTLSFKPDGLNSVGIDFGERVQMNFYDAEGYMFDRTNAASANIDRQLYRLSKADFTSGLFSASAVIDRASGKLTLSALRNMSVKEMVMTVKMRYEYSVRVLTFRFGKAENDSYEVVGVEYGPLSEGLGSNDKVQQKITNDADSVRSFELYPFMSLTRNAYFSLDPPFNSLNVTIPDEMKVALPSMPPEGESGGVDFWGDSTLLKFGVQVLPSFLKDKKVSLTVMPMTEATITFSFHDICIYSNIVFKCRSCAEPHDTFDFKGRMWVYDDSFLTTQVTTSPL